MTRNHRIALLAATALTAAPALAWAAEPPANQDTTIGEIVVTAQKKSERLLDVGLAVTSIDSTQLSEARVSQTTDLTGQVPNVDVKQNIPGAQAIVTVRGVGLNDFSSTNNSTVGVYVDDVFLASFAQMDFNFYDLERVEVLKGPQGTLYGRNSTAGAINIISAAPSMAGNSGQVSVGYGNFQTFEADGYANLVVSDNLAFRFSAKTVQQEEGYWRSRVLNDDLGEQNLLLGRAQMLWTPTEATTVKLKLEGERSRSSLGVGKFFGTIPTGPGITCPNFNNPAVCVDQHGYTDTSRDPFTGDWNHDAPYDVDQWNATLHIDSDLGWAKLAWVTGYIDFKRGFYIDADAAPTTDVEFDQNDKVRQFTQEIRLSGEAGSAEWLLGGYYSWDRVQTHTPGFLDSLFVTHVLITADQETRTQALFGQVKWRLGETLSLTTGLRYTSEDRDYVGGTTDTNPFSSSFLCFVAGACGFPPNPGQHVLTFTDDSISDQNWSWRVGLDYKPSSDTLLYVAVARGVKSGGFFNGVSTSNAALAPYKPEELTDYEAGWKAQLFDRSMLIDASVFYYDYTNLQTQVFTTVGAVTLIKLGNVDTATVKGADLTVTWKPVRGLTLRGGLGLLDTKLGSFSLGPGTPVPAGNKLPNAPDLTFNGSARYEWSLAGDWTASVQGSGHYSDAVYKEALNTPYLSADSYWLFDARAGISNGDWDLSVWGKNLGDERYVTQATDDGLGMGYRVFNAPRTFGITVTRNFN
ncbi:iron complex outermembrane receptor protein [Caulobacter ginsengisoli]|uniref:Iron complex outermembrane receptor protein n=1 Tax=Caulobacter ginsengisoli TaxID=400775 RepID=A0ABU0IS76_9CAUL|nr:TonB-dependent receptor [Caulobacter ginsengisoli]MDQ0464856.1 iron complex outermembrane receptor protein [Caulobacter ginsengisoli]